MPKNNYRFLILFIRLLTPPKSFVAFYALFNAAFCINAYNRHPNNRYSYTSSSVKRIIISIKDMWIYCWNYYQCFILSGTESIIVSQRGREFFLKIQYHFTAINGFPFYIVLAVPAAFSYEIETTKNLTDIVLFLKRLLMSKSKHHLEDSISSSFSSWFENPKNSYKQSERLFFKTFSHLYLLNSYIIV